MSNPYSHTLAVRWVDKDATTLTRLNVSRIGVDYCVWALQQIMDPDEAQDGLTAVTNMYVAAPMKIKVDASTTWTIGWWQSADNRWWLLGNTANVASFTRADAEFYIPTGDIADVPTS
jgi:hypothetical protein